MRPMADERDVRLRLMHAQGNRQGRCRTSERQKESPLNPDPEPIDVPPPSGPERPAPGVPGTPDPAPVTVPDPPSA